MPKPRFSVADAVRVLDLGKPGHVRTPAYVRGHTGHVVQVCGCYLNPEDLALGVASGPTVSLYRVAFHQVELWPEYDGPPADTLVIEIYDHWLDRAV